ncbi:MAG TPA: hypothetical protein VF120_12890 [Ktedonobacterales bacterium]
MSVFANLLGGFKAIILRVVGALVGPSRVVLGMLAFLVGFLTAGAGAFTMIFGAGNAMRQYLATAVGPNLVELVAAAAVGAWVGAAILCIGLAFLWVSRRLDPNGAVRSNKVPTRKRSAAR